MFLENCKARVSHSEGKTAERSQASINTNSDCRVSFELRKHIRVKCVLDIRLVVNRMPKANKHISSAACLPSLLGDDHLGASILESFPQILVLQLQHDCMGRRRACRNVRPGDRQSRNLTPSRWDNMSTRPNPFLLGGGEFI